MSDEKYFVVAEEYACDGVYIDQLVMSGSEEACRDRAFLINFSGSDYQYRDARVFSEEEYEKEYGSENIMDQPYKLHLKDYHEFSWVAAALNFFSKHYQNNRDPLGDCYYDEKEAKEMFYRIEEEFLDYSWETHKQKDRNGEYYCAFEDNVQEGLDVSDWMVEYYDKEKAKSRIKEWYLCNTTMEANCTRIAMHLDSYIIEEALHDTKLYGDACDSLLTKEETESCASAVAKKCKEFYRTEEGKEWINSDD